MPCSSTEKRARSDRPGWSGSSPGFSKVHGVRLRRRDLDPQRFGKQQRHHPLAPLIPEKRERSAAGLPLYRWVMPIWATMPESSIPGGH